MTPASNQEVRGLFWSARSYSGPSRRGIRSTPAEMFASGLLTLNYLLGSRRARPEDVADIANPDFRDLITRIGERLFTEGSGCALYRSDLPPAACSMIRDHLPARKHPVTGEVRSFRARMRHEVLFEPSWVYHAAETAVNVPLLEGINRQPSHRLVDPTQWGDALPDGPRLSADVAKLLADRALIPCDADNLTVRSDADPDTPHQYTYGEFMGGELPPPPVKRRPLITGDSPLYWVDLQQLSFKHGSMLNEGDINRKLGTGYAVTDNVLRVIDDGGFFTTLMQSAQGEDNQVFILPLTLFMMNGRLYAHDHKRAAASLLGGGRYMLGALNQDGELARFREIGYHPTRGLFSRLDRGMLMYLTDAQAAAWGHWFFRVGGEDRTGLLRGIDEGRDDWRTASGSDDDDFAVLHEQVRPRLLESLDDAERLQRRCLGLLDDGMRWIQQIQHAAQGDMARNHLRKLLIGGYILKHEEVDAVLDGRPDAVLARLAPYEAFFEAQRQHVSTLYDRDALLRWELTHIGNPLPPIVGQDWFSSALRDEIALRLPVLRDFMEGGS
ncbi:MAG: hypothetical protein ACI8S6_005641 [Myxococcota bacterium]|jgi:hypothetical protein